MFRSGPAAFALFAFLTLAPLTPALAQPSNAAARADVQRRRVLLVGQAPDSHPPATHEYRAGMYLLGDCLEKQPALDVRVVSADGPWLRGPQLVRDADCVVLFVSEGAKWLHAGPRRLEAFARHAAGRGGLVTLHWGMGAREPRYIDGYLKLFGGCHGGPDRRYKVVSTTVSVNEHPVTRGITDFRIRDEFYYRLKFVDAERTLQPLLRAEIEGKPETVAWAWQRPDGGRSCGFSGGHFHENWRRTEYRRLMTQAVLWTLDRPLPPQGVDVQLRDDAFDLPPR